jgi:hypothetical protein
MKSTIASPVRQNGSGHELQKSKRQNVSKTIKLLISIFIISILFNSCAKDDEVPPSLIGGKWLFDKQIPYTDGIAEPEIDNLVNQAGCNKNYYEFTNENSLIYGNYDADCELTLEATNYLLEGKKIQFKVLRFIGTITTLTETDLYIEFREPFFDAPNDNILTIIKYKRVL